jgi:hypothetical protein
VILRVRTYTGSILGSSFVLLMTAIAGAILGIVAVYEWEMAAGETVALALAAAAFASSFYHFHTQRAHQKLSVRPFLQIASNFSSISVPDFYTFRVTLRNVGLGPGFITEKSLVLDGHETTGVNDEFEQWVQVVNRYTPANGGAECRSGRCDPESALDKGDEIELLAVDFPKGNMSFMDARDVALELSKYIQFSISYRSHYGEGFECAKETT